MKLTVFLSYSRVDIEAADRLFAALTASDIDVLIDRRDIALFEDWKREILELIRQCDTVVFLISAHSVASAVCRWEIEQTTEHAKRLAPVILEPAKGLVLPEDVNRLNYVDISDPARFDSQVQVLARALKTNVGWLKDHTRIGEFARRWTARGRTRDGLLRGADLEEATAWAAARPRDAPIVTLDQQEFLQAGRREHDAQLDREREQVARTRRLQRRVLWAVGGGGSLALVLGAATTWFSVRAQREADAARVAAVVRSAATIVDSDPTTAALVLGTLDESQEPPGGVATASRIARNSISTILRHSWSVSSAEFSGDGTRILTLSNGTARVWHTDGTAGPASWGTQKAPIGGATFAADGAHLFFLDGDRRVLLARTDGTGTPVAVGGEAHRAWHIERDHKTGRILTVDSDLKLRLWNADGGGPPVVLEDGETTFERAAFSPDGTRVLGIAMHDGLVRIWTLEGTPTMVRVGIADSGVVSAALSADNQRLVIIGKDKAPVSNDGPFGTARVWRLGTNDDPRQLGVANEAVLAAFSPDSKHLATVDRAGAARLWELEQMSEPTALGGSERRVSALSFSQDGTRVVAGTTEGTALIWRLDRPIGAPLLLRGHTQAIWSVAVSTDGSRIVSASLDQTARVWRSDGTGGEPVELGESTPAAPFSPDGTRILSLTASGAVRVSDVDGRREAIVLGEAATQIRTATWSPDGTRILTIGRDEGRIYDVIWGGTVRVWRADGSGRPVVFESDRTVTSAVFSADGARIAVVNYDGTARVWFANGKPASDALGSADDRIDRAVFSPDGRRLLTLGCLRARLWRSDGSGRPVALELPQNKVAMQCAMDVSYSTDNIHVAMVSSDGVVLVFRADRPNDVPLVIGRKEDPIRSVAFSPDGSRLLTMSGAPRLFRLDGAEVPLPWKGRLDFSSVLLSPDGGHLLASNVTGTTLWPLDDTGEPLLLTTTIAGNISFSPDGTRVVLESEGATRVVRVGWRLLLQLLRSSTRTCLTVDERREYLGELPDVAQQMWAACEAIPPDGTRH